MMDMKKLQKYLKASQKEIKVRWKKDGKPAADKLKAASIEYWKSTARPGIKKSAGLIRVNWIKVVIPTLSVVKSNTSKFISKASKWCRCRKELTLVAMVELLFIGIHLSAFEAIWENALIFSIFMIAHAFMLFNTHALYQNGATSRDD